MGAFFFFFSLWYDATRDQPHKLQHQGRDTPRNQQVGVGVEFFEDTFPYPNSWMDQVYRYADDFKLKFQTLECKNEENS